MAEHCDTAAVLGAGVMGAGIAAHLAGAGIRTHLLDIVPPGLGDAEKNDPHARNRFAENGIKGALKAKPAAFYDPDAARLIIPGNFDDHMDRLAECDLVIEAVVERMDIKKSLFAKIAAAAGPHTILATNTSGLSIEEIGSDLPEDAQKRLVVMHFFNPVRYMRLLEIVGHPKADPAVVARAARLGEELGKGIVYCKDTANFVANRIAMQGMMHTLKVMDEMGVTLEAVDKFAGPAMGRPKTGIFGLGDLVGIDTLVHVINNCYDTLPDDEERDVFKVPEWIKKLVDSGRTGRKAKSGFYKKDGKGLLVIDPKTLEYREQEKVRFDSLGAAKKTEDVRERIKNVVQADDTAGKFIWKALAGSLCYTARRVGEIADDIVNIDRAMRWGFNWDLGPFETWDAIGVPESIERMKKDGFDVPQWVVDMVAKGQKTFYDGSEAERRFFDVGGKKAVPIPQDPHNVRLLALREDKKRIVKENLGAALVDIGDGCLCVEVHTKMNTLDDDVVGMLKEGVAEAEKNFEALVIGNDGANFGAGANIMLFLMAAKQKDWNTIDKGIREFQSAIQGLRYAKVPVVSAPFQLALGGACEVTMACDATQAHAETYIGLVELGAGVVPAGGGCLRMVERWTGDITGMDAVDQLMLLAEGFLNIGTARVATGAEEGKKYRYLRNTDGISLNRDHLLYHAKQRALGMARAGYRPPRPPVFRAGGYDMAKTMNVQVWGMVEAGYATEYDGVLARHVAHILCGGNVAKNAMVDEQHYLDLEREAFLSLCGNEKSQARMEAILMTGKPLRN
ncbi:MAG: hypothetical protein A2289_08555 [Deltaproteobacteria bacterium RIFOXYA12_FULL_58_15]|nr:MAG: hypothetical protein A2289_08555 [Deltaproteobacteria bacterium RIFOXYA12_FULL_58_15]